MRRFVTTVLLAIAVLAVLCAAADANVTIRVSDSREFLEALGSDRVIEMAPGIYNLSEWDPILNNQPEQAPPYPKLGRDGAPKLANGVSWSEVFDGGELVLDGIKNLTIRGPWAADYDDSLGREGIVVDPRYAFVLKFVNCSDIVIEGLIAAHSEGGFCDGGVFGFENSSRITITGTQMFGSGTYGLELRDVSDMKVAESQIYECTYGIMTVRGGENISFERCTFATNREYTLVGVSGTKNMSFSNCGFFGNSGNMFGVQDTTISVSNTAFAANETEFPIQDSPNVSFSDCEFDEAVG
ncbi:MAG: right-handed parallel beta-helix repeat-containing protein [Deltaproteobacteria bacterium]|nr:right-handed parallel beta-helix repeat-containing protein [Deltaproteobacteria bacterium]